jgi:hypothetical protein
MRKIGINTTGLTPHRAIRCSRASWSSARSTICSSASASRSTGIGDIHDQVRHVKRGFDKACETIEAMQALSQRCSNFQFGIAATIFATNIDDAQNILAWARTKKLDVVFNMLRFTDAMLNNKELEEEDRLSRARGRVHAHVLPRSGRRGIGPQRAGVPVSPLRGHDRERLQRTMPCPFRTQGLLLNPYGDLYY